MPFRAIKADTQCSQIFVVQYYLYGLPIILYYRSDIDIAV